MTTNRSQTAMTSLLRCAAGLIWIAGTMFNALSTMRHPEVYQSLAAETSTPVFRWLFGEIVSVHRAFWTVLLVIGELFLGVLTLAKGRRGQVGLALGALWSALLFPLVWPFTLMMGPYAVLLAWLASRHQDATLLDSLRAMGGRGLAFSGLWYPDAASAGPRRRPKSITAFRGQNGERQGFYALALAVSPVVTRVYCLRCTAEG